MDYNLVEIGTRVREERKARGLSQDKFLEAIKIPFGRKRLSQLENGEEGGLSWEFLLAASKLFDCDIGYLLGEYGDGRTRDDQFVADRTGLLQENITFLATIMRANKTTRLMDIVNDFAKSEHFLDLLFHISDYATDCGEEVDLSTLNLRSWVTRVKTADVAAYRCQATFSKILDDIRDCESKKVDTRPFYGFLNILLEDGKLTEEEYLEIEAEFDRGDFSRFTEGEVLNGKT